MKTFKEYIKEKRIKEMLRYDDGDFIEDKEDIEEDDGSDEHIDPLPPV